MMSSGNSALNDINCSTMAGTDGGSDSSQSRCRLVSSQCANVNNPRPILLRGTGGKSGLRCFIICYSVDSKYRLETNPVAAVSSKEGAVRPVVDSVTGLVAVAKEQYKSC